MIREAVVGNQSESRISRGREGDEGGNEKTSAHGGSPQVSGGQDFSSIAWKSEIKEESGSGVGGKGRGGGGKGGMNKGDWQHSCFGKKKKKKSQPSCFFKAAHLRGGPAAGGERRAAGSRARTDGRTDGRTERAGAPLPDAAERAQMGGGGGRSGAAAAAAAAPGAERRGGR